MFLTFEERALLLPYSEEKTLSIPSFKAVLLTKTPPDTLSQRSVGCFPHQSRRHLGGDPPLSSPLQVLLWSQEVWL